MVCNYTRWIVHCILSDNRMYGLYSTDKSAAYLCARHNTPVYYIIYNMHICTCMVTNWNNFKDLCY